MRAFGWIDQFATGAEPDMFTCQVRGEKKPADKECVANAPDELHLDLYT